jgi:YidC/Oxa1 family membrane protein insertase
VEKQRNLILAVVLMGLLLIGWDYGIAYFYPQPKGKPAATAPANPAAAPASNGPPAKPTREGGLQAPADVALEQKDLAQELSAGHRVAIDAPGLKGSINLVGGVVDDLTLVRHRETIDKNSPPVRLFSPAGTRRSTLPRSAGSARTGWPRPTGRRCSPPRAAS